MAWRAASPHPITHAASACHNLPSAAPKPWRTLAPVSCMEIRCDRNCCRRMKQEDHTNNRLLLVDIGANLHRKLLLGSAVVSSQLASGLAIAQTTAAVSGAQPTATYVPSPYTPGWEVWFGAAIATIPFVIGSYEFGKRILIQLRCDVCNGRGLVQKGKYLKKCSQCGGFFPWISWKLFLTSTAAPGNGGPLLQPKGQTTMFYTVPPPRPAATQTSDSPTSIPATEHLEAPQGSAIQTTITDEKLPVPISDITKGPSQ